MKVLTVVGARPQFIKAWPVSRALREAGIEEALVHSGQHYDDTMSRIFFDELGLDTPVRHLGIGSGTHGEQTGRMMIALEQSCLDLAPDCVVVFGDTNTTLAGALVACKMRIPVAHIEAGLRSWNRAMPEEVNRVVTDHVSRALFCPSPSAAEHLAREGIVRGVHVIGDVMQDALIHFAERARKDSDVLNRLRLKPGEYHVATVHRAEITDDVQRLRRLLSLLGRLDRPVILPLHPRTRARLLREASALGRAALEPATAAPVSTRAVTGPERARREPRSEAQRAASKARRTNRRRS